MCRGEPTSFMFYETKITKIEERPDILVPYVKAGPETRELCLPDAARRGAHGNPRLQYCRYSSAST